MSFYWQNAVRQESGQPGASTWDNINLGNSPPQQQQPAQQSFSYENQQTQGGYEQYVNPYAAEWAAYHAQQAALQEQQNQAQVYQQPPPVTEMEHQPIIAQAQPVVQSQSTISVPTTDQTAQESQSNHTTYDGWGHEGWSSHEPSVEPQVQHTVDAHQYYNQQQQYYQEQIPQQPPTIEQNWTPSEATAVSSTTATIVESPSPSMVEIPPIEVATPIVEQEPLQPSPHQVHYPTQPSAPAAVFDLGFDDEIVEKEEKKDEETIKQEPNEESHAGWGETCDEEKVEETKEEEGKEVRESSHIDVSSHGQPRTSTPSPVVQHNEPEPTVSPIDTSVRESAPSPSPIPCTPLTMSSFPSPPTILAPSEIAPPPPPPSVPSTIDTQSAAPLSPPIAAFNGLHTENTQKTSPPASTDSWVEVSSSGSDAIQPTNRGGRNVIGKDGVPPLATSSPARQEKRPSVSSVNGIIDKGLERRREDSDSTHDSKRNVRDKFRDVKSQYSTIFARLDGHRSSAREGNKTPTRVNPLLVAASNGGVRLGVPTGSSKNSSTPKDYHPDSTYPPPLANDLSAIGEARMYGHLDQSANMSMESRGYGEDIVNEYRRDRHRMRSSRPASRAKSEYGDPVLMPDRGERHNRSAYDHSHMVHPQYGYYPAGRYSLGRHSSMGMPYAVDPYENARRPHSTYDQAAQMRMARSGRGTDYDAFEYVTSEGESEDEEEEMPNESDNEMRRISHAAAAHSRSSMGIVRGGRPMPRPLPPMERLGEDEISYLGFVNMDLRMAKRLIHDHPPPIDFWTLLDPLQKVAFLYYTSLHRKNYPVASMFGDRFTEKYLPLKRMGYQPQQALAKVCGEMREHYNAKVASNQRAYEASQRQLFSDEYDRGTPESRFSDRPSVYDHNQSDIDDVASNYAVREPLKFRLPHAFATFGPGGKIIQVQPSKSIGTVHMTDVHSIVRDREMQRNVALSNNFKGPLFPHQTPPHVVRAYITRQMDRIRRSDLAQTDPRNDDIIDCLLIWQLLEKVVQQHGRVTGPDMAELLTRSAHHRGSKRGGEGGNGNTLEIAPPTPDPKAYETFCQYLLQGLVDDAITYAMGEGLYSDALSLARRLVVDRVEEIEKRHFSTRPPSHPVLTLMAVASNEAAPCLSTMASEERGGWRCHAAILFANLSASPFAMETIKRLGEELARRDCQAAADFCFLSVALLAGVDTFTPATHDPVTGLPSSVRRHIELIHASIPDDVAESTLCEYGFSLTDLHATEIFDYGSRLSGGATNLAISVPYQRRRIQYARLLAGWGGFALDAFRYCTEVARTMWENMSLFTTRELEELTELAERLHKVAAADEASTLWIESLSQLIPSLKTAMYAPALEAHGQPVAAVVHEEKQFGQEEEKEKEQRQRSESISTEAAAWHSREEPLEMKGEKIEEEKKEEERRGGEDNVAIYAAYQQQQQQQQQQQSQYNHESPVVSSESHHSAFHHLQKENHHDHHSTSYSSHSHDSTHSHSGYSSETRTERIEGVSSEESTPTRERSSSIHSNPPNPLAPSHASHPSHPSVLPTPTPTPTPLVPPMRVPAPMPALPIAPPSAPMPTMQPVHKQPQLIKQETAGSSTQQQPSLSHSGGGKGSNGGGGGGFFGGIANKLRTAASKAVGNKEMILPDDRQKSIYYDEKLGQWVGTGVEQEVAPPPPPSIPGSMNGLSGMDGGNGGGMPPSMMGGGLKAARNSGGSRYFNPLNDASNKPSSGSMGGMPPMGMPAPPTFPTQFSFIPSQPDDAVSDSPFSETAAVAAGEGEGHDEHAQQ